LLNYCQEIEDPLKEGFPDFDYNVTHYKIKGDVLSFFNKQNDVILQYHRLSTSKTKTADIFGKTWQLASITGMETAYLAAFTLNFVAQKAISDLNWLVSDLDNLRYSKYRPTFNGTNSCQNYKGNYFVVEKMLTVASLSRKSTFFDNLSE
jgi:hypothetical protein